MRPDDFDVFYAASAPVLVRQLYAMTGSAQEAQDVVQEAGVRAWQRWATVSECESPQAWVRTVAWRLAVSRRRRLLSHLRAENRRAAGADPHSPEISENGVAIGAALRTLPDSQRRAVVLYHLCGLTIDEVARETGANPNTVKTRLARGRAALAGQLGDSHLPAAAGTPALSPAATPSPALTAAPAAQEAPHA